MINFIKKYWIYAAVIIAAFFVLRGRGESESESLPSNGLLPMFFSGGMGAGGQIGAFGATPNIPLGGEIWQEPTVPLSENPDVRIAEIYAGLQMAALQAQERMANDGRISSDQNLDGREAYRTSGGNQLANDRYNTALANSWTLANQSAFTDTYVKAAVNDGINTREARQIFDYAQSNNLSANYVAGKLAGAGLNVSAADVNAYAQQAGFGTLKTDVIFSQPKLTQRKVN